MPSLVLPPDLRARLIDIARAALPNEACGLLGGQQTSGVRNGGSSTGAVAGVVSVASVHPVRNDAASPTRFALDGQGMLDAERRIDDAGQVVLGVFHSHPSSAAVPSVRDLADAAVFDPAGVWVHVIVSMQGFAPNVAAYMYGDGGATELPITATRDLASN